MAIGEQGALPEELPDNWRENEELLKEVSRFLRVISEIFICQKVQALLLRFFFIFNLAASSLSQNRCYCW